MQDETRIIQVLGFGASYIREFTVVRASLNTKVSIVCLLWLKSLLDSLKSHETVTAKTFGFLQDPGWILLDFPYFKHDYIEEVYQSNVCFFGRGPQTTDFCGDWWNVSLRISYQTVTAKTFGLLPEWGWIGFDFSWFQTWFYKGSLEVQFVLCRPSSEVHRPVIFTVSDEMCSYGFHVKSKLILCK